jgi:hypothetical protein
MTRRIAATLAAAVALTAAPAHATPTTGRGAQNFTQPPTIYTVKQGDTLSQIGADTPGGWTRLAWVNRHLFDHPDLIEVGVVLVIPERDGRRWEYVPTRPTVSVSRSYERVTPTGDVWWRLAQCESSGDQHAHSPSGTYHSYFQWSLTTWASLGMTGDPHNYSYAVQLAAARRLQARSGWGQWPACSSRLGLR